MITKRTFTNVVAGRPGYTITKGEIIYEGESILGMFPDERARKGIFLALQYPVELPGIRNREFLRTALEALREARGETKLAIREFNKFLEEKAKAMDILLMTVTPATAATSLPAEVLAARDTPVLAGETVYLVAIPYEDKAAAQRVFAQGAEKRG